MTPINLNKARKARARSQREQQATENRVKFGRTKAEKARDALQQARTRKPVDDARREDEP